jgi:hypothetical protein
MFRTANRRMQCIDFNHDLPARHGVLSRNPSFFPGLEQAEEVLTMVDTYKDGLISLDSMHPRLFAVK